MKRLFVVGLLVGAFLALLLAKQKPAAPPPQPQPAPPAPTPAPMPAEKPLEDPQAVEFRADGVNEKLLRVNEGVAGADNVRVAVQKKGDATHVLLLTPGVAKYYLLDADWTLSDFPALSAANFQEPPPPIVQTMSIFKSLTKRELNYSAERGDRIVILVCPKEQWAALKLQWPK